MFGLFYTLSITIGSVFHAAKKAKENEENKIRYKLPDGLTYIDIKGHPRFLSNNEPAFYFTRNGDYVLEDMSGHIHRNFSEEKRKEECETRRRESLSKNESTYCIDEDYHEYDRFCKGRRYKDFKTGDVYVIRHINFKFYYMRITDGMIVRETDYQIKLDNYRKEKGDKIFSFEGINIDKFNEKQKAIKDKNILYKNYEYRTAFELNK